MKVCEITAFHRFLQLHLKFCRNRTINLFFEAVSGKSYSFIEKPTFAIENIKENYKMRMKNGKFLHNVARLKEVSSAGSE